MCLHFKSPVIHGSVVVQQLPRALMIGRLMTFSGVLASSRASFFCFIVHEHVINMINSPQQRSDKIYKLSETQCQLPSSCIFSPHI